MKRSQGSALETSTTAQEKIKVHTFKFRIIEGSNISETTAHGIDILLQFDTALINIKKNVANLGLKKNKSEHGIDIYVFQNPLNCFQLAAVIQQRKNENDATIKALKEQIKGLKEKKDKSSIEITQMKDLQKQLDKISYYLIEFGQTRIKVTHPDLVKDRTGNVDSYQVLAIKLTNISNQKPSSLTPDLQHYDHYVAKDILAILQGREPTYYPKQKQTLCEAAVLLFCVEPSRQDASFGTSLLLLDLIANQRTYGSSLSKKPYLWRNALDSAKLTSSGWQMKMSTSPLNFYLAGQPYGPSTAYQLLSFPPSPTLERSKYIGGKSPVSTGTQLEIDLYNTRNSDSPTSNAGIYSTRSSLIQSMRDSNRKLALLERSIARHRIVLKEISILNHWLEQEHALLTGTLTKSSDIQPSDIILNQYQHLFLCRMAQFYGITINPAPLLLTTPLHGEDMALINALHTENLKALALDRNNAQRILFIAGTEASPDFYLMIYNEIITKQFPVNFTAQDSFGCTALHYLIMNKCLASEIMKIINDNPTILFRNNLLGESPLYLSISHPEPSLFIDLMKIVIENKLHLATPDLFGNTPLHYLMARPNNNESGTAYFNAYESQNPQPTIDITLVANKLGQLPIHIAAQTGNHHGIIKLHNKTKMNKQEHINMPDNNGNTPLLLALKNSAELKTITFMIKIGANPLLINIEGKCAFHYAISQYSNGNALNLLLPKLNGDLNQQLVLDLVKLTITTNNFDALLVLWDKYPWASKELDLIQLIHENYRTYNQDQCFHLLPLAIKAGDLNMFNYCIKEITDLTDIKDSLQNTLLHVAAINCQNVDILNKLMSKLDLTTINMEGKTPLQLASENGNIIFLKVAQEYQARQSSTISYPILLPSTTPFSNPDPMLVVPLQTSIASPLSTSMIISTPTVQSPMTAVNPSTDPSSVAAPVLATGERSTKRIRLDKQSTEAPQFATPSNSSSGVLLPQSLPSLTGPSILPPVTNNSSFDAQLLPPLPSLSGSPNLLPATSSSAMEIVTTYSPDVMQDLLAKYCSGTRVYMGNSASTSFQETLTQNLLEFKLNCAGSFGIHNDTWLFMPIRNDDNSWGLIAVNYSTTPSKPTKIAYFDAANRALPEAIARSLQGAFEKITFEQHQISPNDTHITVAELIRHISNSGTTNNASAVVQLNIQGAQARQSEILNPSTQLSSISPLHM